MLEDKLEKLITPVVTAMGYELAGCRYQQQGNSGLLQIFIERPEGVDIEDCAKISRQVAGILDVEDPIRGRYRLEVSSPGLDRPMFKQSDYQRFIGKRLKLRLRMPRDGQRNFKGVLQSVEEDGITLQLDDGETSWQITFGEIEWANLVPEF